MNEMKHVEICAQMGLFLVFNQPQLILNKFLMKM
jgi:hypothetical protein